MEKNLRTSKEDFLTLVDMIKPYTKSRSAKVWQDVFSLKKRVAITVHYLKDQRSMQMTANAFGIARCTVGQVIHEICYILLKNVGPELITFPETEEEVSKATAEFLQRFGFPQVIGCVDRTHVPIKQPSENAHDYYSYKQLQSTVKPFVMPSDNSLTLK